MKLESLERLKRILDAPESDADLAEAALLLAQEEYPQLDVVAYLRRLDEMAQAVRDTLPANAPAAEIILALNRSARWRIGTVTLPNKERGKSTFSSQVRVGIRLKNWKTKPM